MTDSGKRKPPAAGRGRPKGARNKATAEIKDMVRQALDGAGGVSYLIRQADENPPAFMGLVGRIMPKEIQATIKQAPDRTEVDAMLRRVGMDPDQVWTALH